MKSEPTPRLVEDSDWTIAPRGPIGHVDEVNGRGALAVPDFVASRYELIVLLKHWAEIELDARFWWFCYEQVGSSDTRLRAFADRRMDRIAAALADDEAVRKALDGVYEEYRGRHDGLAWRVFTGKASAEEEREFRREQDRLLDGEEHEPGPQGHSQGE